MAVTGLSQAIKKSNQLKVEVAERRAARAATAGAIVGQAYAQMLTPIDTSNLINSQYRRMEKRGNVWRALIGYTAAYAAAVHAASGKLKGQPRAHFGTTRAGVDFGGGTGVGNYWDPDAEPGFLTKGFEDHRAEIDEAVYRELNL